MTAVVDPVGSNLAPESERRRFRWWWPLVALAGVLVFLNLLRLVTGADDITSAGTLRATLVATMPIALAALGGLWSERAGVVNIGLEGMMILGTFGAGYFGYLYGPWAGVLGAIFMGLIGGLIHAVATVTFGVDHIISGVALNLISLGAVQYLAALTFGDQKERFPGGGPTQSPKLGHLPTISDLLPAGLADAVNSSKLTKALIGDLSLLTVIALLLILGTWWVLWHTAFGLRLRSCGESPAAAESLGVKVMRYKFIAVLMSGAMAGLAGGFLALVASSGFRDGQTGGRGYIGLAAMIFGNWRPGGMLAGSALFGYTQTLGLRQGGTSVHALLLAIGVLGLALAFWQWRAALRTHRATQGAGLLAGNVSVLLLTVAALIPVALYFAIDEVPGDFTAMTPYLVTLLVLAFASQRLRMPAADGQIYRKGSAG